ncbi:MAG: UPF0182 family protein [Syntrophales bacterium]|jgi:hypothetical protein|nr:UPF0182 family protein [Syntrophales bacterium]
MYRGLKEPGQFKNRIRTALIIVVLLATVGFFEIAWLVTDWFWFQEVKYEAVFWVTLLAKLTVGCIIGAIFLVLFGGNLYLAEKIARKNNYSDYMGTQIPSLQLIGERSLVPLIAVVSVIVSVFMGMSAAVQWKEYLLFLQGLPFGLPDPLYQKDIGFYVFHLPFIVSVYQWLSFMAILVIIGTSILYFVRGTFLFVPPRTWKIAPPVRTHLLILFSGLFFLGILGAWIDLYQLIFIKRGVVFGPGYTDTTTQIWVLRSMIVMNLLAALSILFYAFKDNWKIPVAAIVALLAVSMVGKGLYPNMVQKFKVLPNEIVLEKPFLEHNIKYTRLAYRLDNIEDQEFSAEASLTQADLQKNDLTVKNIRLWDHGPLLQTYSQLQEIRTYYKFIDVDNDRYMINNEYRQVMLSARELSYSALPSRTWVNEHLTYTHGYGVVLGPVNRITQEGLPEFFIKDIPPVAVTDVRVNRPEIYYGEQSNEYVFVRAKRPEFDYPVGDKNVYAKYEGKGGVPLSFWRKILYAIRFGSITILLSDDITNESRIMYHRQIKQRVGKIVPFLRLDADPYLVISKEGRLVWVLDGYTVTDRYPYSEPVENLGNYVRNSVKAIVDAYDGTVNLYISDADDPIIRTYARIFPGIFQPMDAMPADLKSHMRYPQGMLTIQAMMYRAYHMEDPQVFYNKEDLWSIPGKIAGGGEQEMEPYYTIMKLPEGKKEEFILLLPFTPSNKDNMSAWMAARCDAPHYGKLIVYNFPKQRLVYGPRQIEARIDQDTEISKQLSLWNQSGSQVIRGSLLAIPIEKSILYVEPLYLAAEKGQLPELKRVIVAFGNTIAMEQNLELALQRIFGGQLMKETPLETGTAPAAKVTTDREIALEALDHYRKAQEMLRQNNWSGYGEELRKMDTLLRSLEKR